MLVRAPLAHHSHALGRIRLEPCRTGDQRTRCEVHAHQLSIKAARYVEGGIKAQPLRVERDAVQVKVLEAQHPVLARQTRVEISVPSRSKCRNSNTTFCRGSS